MNKFKSIIMWLLMAIVVLLIIFNIILTFYVNAKHTEDVNARVNEVLKQIEDIPKPINGKDGYTPQLNVDYFNGVDGKPGKDSTSTHTKETIIKETPIKGDKGDKGDDAYFDIRCDTKKNRWEIKLSPSDKWQKLNGIDIKCTIDL